MKLLVVTNMWPSSRKPNFGVFVADRVEAYRRLGADVYVAKNDDPRRGPIRTPVKYIRLLVIAVWTALTKQPDMVEGHYLWPTALHARIAAGVGRCPYVLYAHGSDIVNLPQPFLTRAVRKAAEVHTNSEDSADRVRAVFGNVPVVVSPPGVDLKRFEPGTPEPGRIVFIGDLVMHKGVDVLLEAVSMIRKGRLTVVGDGLERSRLEQQARQLGLDDRIEWVGRVGHEQVAGHLRRAWVAAVPSRSDALGQVAVEALACGVPVVVSDVGGLASVPDTDTGTLVDAEDAVGLAAGIEFWLELSYDERQKAGVAARGRAGEFDVNTMAGEALHRMEDLITTKDSNRR